VLAFLDTEFTEFGLGPQLLSGGLVTGPGRGGEFYAEVIIDSGANRWESTRCRILPLNVYQFTGFDAGRLASNAYFKSQAMAPFSRHHALYDARVSARLRSCCIRRD